MALPKQVPYLKRVDCVGTLITRESFGDRQVLLVWNADWRRPAWSLPGGARECGESLQDAAVREVREETGLDVELGPLVDVHEIIGLGGRVHLVIFTFKGQVSGGTLVPDGRGEPEEGGVTAAQWFSINEAKTIEGLGRVLSRDQSATTGAICTVDRRVNEPEQASAAGEGRRKR